MMNTFDIQKNLIAAVGALTLAVMSGTSPAAHAEDNNVTKKTSTSYDFEFNGDDIAELRTLLSTPNLSKQDYRRLQHVLRTMHEESA